MRKDNIRKYILPNIPYLFVLWACLKAGTAYRLAAGTDLAHKLVGMTAALGPAFADFAPGLNSFDWLVGIAGAAGIRLLIYCKAKKAKKFRPDAEYGSARWGGPKDIAPFADPKFENNVILTKTEFLTTNTQPKNPANARNLNACVIGSSGSGKTRFWLTPQLLQAHSSYVLGGDSTLYIVTLGGQCCCCPPRSHRRGRDGHKGPSIFLQGFLCMPPLSPSPFPPHLLEKSIDGFTLGRKLIQRLWSVNDAVFNCMECDAMPRQKNLNKFTAHLSVAPQAGIVLHNEVRNRSGLYRPDHALVLRAFVIKATKAPITKQFWGCQFLFRNIPG